MLHHYHILFTDPFISTKNISAFIASELDLEDVKIGHLFGSKAYLPEVSRLLNDGLISYYSLFEKIILEEIEKTKRNLLIPNYPRFIESLSDLERIISTLEIHGYFVEKIWYVQNTDIEKTAAESAALRGKRLAPETVVHAYKNQEIQAGIISAISEKYKITYLHSDSLVELPEATRHQIDAHLKF